MADFNSESWVRETCQRLNLEACDNFRAGSYDFPQGWQALVERMLTAMRGCKVQIFSIREDHGLLDVRMVASQESELAVLRAIYVYQQWASMTCVQCGARGRKTVLSGKVRVLCAGCINK